MSPSPVSSPLLLRPVALDAAPAEVAARLRRRRGLVFFDAALETGEAGQLSIVAAEPCEVVGGTLERDFPRLQAALARRRCDAPDLGLPLGFAAGWVSYEGEFTFGFYEHALIFRHADGAWFELGSFLPRLAVEGPAGPVGRIEFQPEMGRAQYCAIVRRAQEYIAAGDIYQVNLAHRFSARWAGDPFGFHEALREVSPAPCGAYLALADRTVVSASPETFLAMSGRAVRTRPIKGTRPRHADATADEKSAYDLLTSPKEVAELVMITDLERNDLGQVCDYGSVAVRELLKLERFAQVFHLVSTVEGRLRPGVDHAAALRACFPGGSITGAPKRRAREIIAELEPVPRGLYTGALGWLGFNGESHFSIAIRTAVFEAGRAHFHVGAGIVADSQPEQEWQETLDKAAGLLRAAGGGR